MNKVGLFLKKGLIEQCRATHRVEGNAARRYSEEVMDEALVEAKSVVGGQTPHLHSLVRHLHAGHRGSRVQRRIWRATKLWLSRVSKMPVGTYNTPKLKS